MEFGPMDVVIIAAGLTFLAALCFAVFFRYQDKQEEKAKQQVQKQ